MAAGAVVPTNDGALQRFLRTTACRRRSDCPEAFDAAWRTASGIALPDWLLIDDSLLRLVEEWIATPTYSAEKSFLAANHADLLTPGAQVAIEEIALGDAAARLLRIIATTRSEGIDAAYAPWLAGETESS